jgi:hypothetical protein
MNIPGESITPGKKIIMFYNIIITISTFFSFDC